MMMLTTLPGTAFVPCINSLKTDWVYDDLRAHSVIFRKTGLAGRVVYRVLRKYLNWNFGY